MTENLTQMRICVEKPLPHEKHIMKHISDRANSHHHFKKLSAAFMTQKIWPNNATITVSFVASPNTIKSVDWTPLATLRGLKNNDGSSVKLDPIEEEIRKLSPIEAVKKVVRERIQPLVGLKFIFVPQGGVVRVGFNPHGGSYSLVGTDCIKSNESTTMNLGCLDAGIIMHEFCHVLGMIHEHANPKGKYISWDDSKVYQWSKQTQGWDHTTTYHNIIERYNVDQLNASEFDPKSIMLYFFPPQLTTNKKGTSSNHILSREDVLYISKMYPNGTSTPLEFYNNVYGESIHDTGKSGEVSDVKINWKMFLYILTGLVGLVVLVIFVFLILSIIKKRSKGDIKKIGYSEWRAQFKSSSSRSYEPTPIPTRKWGS